MACPIDDSVPRKSIYENILGMESAVASEQWMPVS